MTDPFERAVLREKLERREKGTRRLNAGFRAHARIYAAVNLGLILTWLLDNAFSPNSAWREPWFLYSIVGWGIALALHWRQVRVRTQRTEGLRARLDSTTATP